MEIQFNEYGYKRGYIDNVMYSYKIKKLEDGKWGITHITYYFRRKDDKTTVVVTDELREYVKKEKYKDEYRLRKDREQRIKYSHSEIPLDVLLHSEQPSNDEPILAKIERKEDRKYLENAIDKLTDKQQRVIRLKYFGGMSTSEIAYKENISISSVSHTEKRALERLAILLIKYQQKP